MIEGYYSVSEWLIKMLRSRIKSEWLEGINKFNTLEMIQQKCRSNGKGELSLGRNSSLKFFQPTPTPSL